MRNLIVTEKSEMGKSHMKRRYVIVFARIGMGTVSLVCVAVAFAVLRGRSKRPSLPPVPEATGTPSEVRVKPVVRKDAARKPAAPGCAGGSSRRF